MDNYNFLSANPGNFFNSQVSKFHKVGSWYRLYGESFYEFFFL
jgi:hypothetical protein